MYRGRPLRLRRPGQRLEGISGHEEFRGDLRLLYLACLAAGTGGLAALHIVPLQARQLSLRRAGAADSAWMCQVLGQISQPFGTRVTSQPDGSLLLRPEAA